MAMKCDDCPNPRQSFAAYKDEEAGGFSRGASDPGEAQRIRRLMAWWPEGGRRIDDVAYLIRDVDAQELLQTGFEKDVVALFFCLMDRWSTSELGTSRNVQSTSDERPSTPRLMKQLTPTEWARARDRIVTLSMLDRGPIVRAEWTAWLAERPGSGWFYPMGDQIYFGAQADAEAFRHWIMAAV